MTQHAHLSATRWASFSSDQQILMIANEMNRAAKLAREGDRERLQNGYERVLQLVDLTIRSHRERSLVRELLRWRDLVAELYVSDAIRFEEHRTLLRCLLYFTPAASQQIPYLFTPLTSSGRTPDTPGASGVPSSG